MENKAKLSIEPKYKIGDMVHICNDYGIYLGHFKIIGIGERTGRTVYYYDGSETPWFAESERNCFDSPVEILHAMKARLNYYRKYGDVAADTVS